MAGPPVTPDAPLAPLTTLGLGGCARRLVTIEHEAELPEALGDAEARGERVFVLGGGSNVVVADTGFPGLVVRIASRGVAVERHADFVRLDVAAGENWDSFVERTIEEGYRGLEALSGIPGLVGATPIQNVGAYGHEVKETLVRVRAYDRSSRRIVDIDRSGCAFGYRTSMFRGQDRYVVVGVVFELEVGENGARVAYAELAKTLGVPEGGSALARDVRAAVLALRRSKGMVLDPNDPDSVSVGSFFVNPTLSRGELDVLERRAAAAVGASVPKFATDDGRFKVPAAWLVERAGYAKGYGAGRIGVSRKHALALVNRGGGTSTELVALSREIQSGVEVRFGVVLQPEPVFVGFEPI